MRLTFFIVLLTTVSGYAQEKIIYYDYSWKETPDAAMAAFVSVITKTDSGWLRGDFYSNGSTPQMTGVYADEACKLRNGPFTWYYPGNKTEKQGVFVNGRKHGLWLEFFPSGNLMDSTVYNDGVMTNYRLRWHNNGMLWDSTVSINDSATQCYRWFDNGYPSETGMLINDKEHGNWKFLHRNGKLAADIDFDMGTVVNAAYFDSTGKPAGDEMVTDHKAVFGKDDHAFRKYLEKKLYWPSGLTFDNAKAAVVVVNFSLNENGEVENCYVSVPLHPAFDQIALKVVKSSPRWYPALQHNRPMRSWHSQAINFSLGQ